MGYNQKKWILELLALIGTKNSWKQILSQLLLVKSKDTDEKLQLL